MHLIHALNVVAQFHLSLCALFIEFVLWTGLWRLRPESPLAALDAALGHYRAREIVVDTRKPPMRVGYHEYPFNFGENYWVLASLTSVRN